MRLVSRVADVDFGRHDLAVARLEQHVVEGDSLVRDLGRHGCSPAKWVTVLIPFRPGRIRIRPVWK